MEVNKGTKLTLSLETIISGVVTLGMIIGMWFTLASPFIATLQAG